MNVCLVHNLWMRLVGALVLLLYFRLFLYTILYRIKPHFIYIYSLWWLWLCWCWWWWEYKKNSQKSLNSSLPVITSSNDFLLRIFCIYIQRWTELYASLNHGYGSRCFIIIWFLLSSVHLPFCCWCRPVTRIFLLFLLLLVSSNFARQAISSILLFIIIFEYTFFQLFFKRILNFCCKSIFIYFHFMKIHLWNRTLYTNTMCTDITS